MAAGRQDRRAGLSEPVEDGMSPGEATLLAPPLGGRLGTLRA
jgi:hypothetical protein